MFDEVLFKTLTDLCKEHLQNQNWLGLRDDAESLLKKFPEHAHGISWLTIAEWRLGDHKKAETLAARAIKEFPQNAWVWENQARLANFSQDWALASKRWEECIALFPNSIGAYVEGSRAYINQRMPQEAQKLLDLGRRKSPDNWHLLVAQADYFVDQSEWSKARAQWLIILQKFPDSVVARRKSVDIMHRTQDHIGALIVMMEWINSEAGVQPNEYLVAVRAFVRAFDDLDLSEPRNGEFLVTLVNQPLGTNNPSEVSELVKFLQSLPLSDTPKYQKIVNFAKVLFQDLNLDQNREIRLFSLAVGIPDLAVSELELFDLISNSDIDRFSRYFSGYLPHVENVRALKLLLLQKADTNFLSSLSEAGLKNLHLFAATDPDFNSLLQAEITKKIDGPKLSKRILAPGYNKNRIRIAVCISGQLRGYKSAYPSWNALNLQDQDTHLFVHSWYNIGQKYPAPINAARSFSGRFLTCFRETSGSYGFAHLESEYPTLFNTYRTGMTANLKDIKEFYSTDAVILEDDSDQKFLDYTNPMKMFYKIEQSWNMVKDSGKDFDLIIRIRPDKELRTISEVDWADLYRICSTKPTICTDGPFRINYDLNLIVGDQFAISTPDLMKYYSEIYSHTLDGSGQIRDRAEYKHVHRKLAFSLYNEGIVARNNSYIVPGLPLNPEELGASAILDLITKDIERRKTTHLDEKFIAALRADIK